MLARGLGMQKELEGDTTGTGDQLIKERGHHAQFIKLGEGKTEMGRGMFDLKTFVITSYHWYM